MWQDLVHTLILGGSYGLMAIGLTMVYGLLKILHVAHAGVYTLGAYAGLFVLQITGGNFWAGLAAGMLAAGLFGVLIYRGIYVHLLKMPRIVPLIASIGLFILLMDLFRLVAGPYSYEFPAQIAFPPLKTRWFSLTEEQTLLLVLTAVFLGAVFWIVNWTPLGVAWRACAQDLEIAQAVGINVPRVVALNFFVGSALAGAAGILWALYYNTVSPTMGGVVAYKAFVVVVLGGFGSIGGSVIAGLLLAGTETFLMGLEWFTFPRDAIAFLVLILVLMFKPTGLFGKGVSS